jgi:hypothetical protein
VLILRFCYSRNSRKSHKIKLLGEAVSLGKTFVALGFGAIPGLFSVVGEFARIAGTTVRDLEPQDKVAAVVIPPEEAKTQPEEGLLQ